MEQVGTLFMDFKSTVLEANGDEWDTRSYGAVQRICYRSKQSIPWTWGSYLIGYGESRDREFRAHLIEPSSDIDWEAQKPNLIKQLILLEYALATRSEITISEQHYMERAGVRGERVLNKEYKGVYFDDWWMVSVTFENIDQWVMHWEAKRTPRSKLKPAGFRTPEFDLTGAYECLSGDCQGGDGKAKFLEPDRTYSGPFFNGKPHGNGVLELDPGLTVKANFEEGLVKDSAVFIGP